MTKIQNTKRYDLEERTFLFAQNCARFVKKLHKTIAHIEYGKQLVRSSGSVAANYIEANESLSKKDFIHRIKICRKEVKESRLWVRLSEVQSDSDSANMQRVLIQEATELMKIFGAILEKSR